MNLQMPTDENPFIYDNNCIFYGKYLIVDGLKLKYKNLALICFKSEKKYMNGFSITDNADAEYFFTKSKEAYFHQSDDLKSFNMTISKGLLPINNHLIKKFDFLHKFLSDVSLKSRYERLNYFLKRDGYFSIQSVDFHNNGDVYSHGIFQGNIQKAFKENKLILGVKFGGYKNKINDPYVFGFNKGTKFLGFVEDNFEINVYVNRDIFDICINNCIHTGSMIK